jgi:DNA-binding HxlR family transcriptional regulator
VEYELTALGRSVLQPVKAFLNWSLKAFPDIKHAREVFDRTRAQEASRER